MFRRIRISVEIAESRAKSSALYWEQYVRDNTVLFHGLLSDDLDNTIENELCN